MKDWTQTLIRDTKTIREAVAAIDAAGLQIAMVVDSEQRLLGTVTDGDIRRGILSGVTLEAPVSRVMNGNPTTARDSDDRDTLLNLMRQRRLHQIPILDATWRVVGLEVLDNLLRPTRRDNPVVLMAGGLGTRLRPLTNDCPKPLLKVGNKPILETILDSFIEHGFHRFYISVNYKAAMIEQYFGDGSKWDVEITYLREDRRMGTAGPLGLIPEPVDLPMIVMNGDLLTKLNFGHLLDFHQEHVSQATMCVREYDMQVPYGVVETEGHRIVRIDEKPVHRFFVNAGVYVLEPQVLSYIPRGEFYDMPRLFEEVVEGKQPTAVFPIREYWMDVGQMDDFVQADGEYQAVFEN